MNDLEKLLDCLFYKKDSIYYMKESSEGYWSNLSLGEQKEFLKSLQSDTTRNVVKKKYPNFENIIFDPMRAVGLRFLEIKKHEVGIDYGCMWGNLLIYCAKKCQTILGIDQTKESLEFVKYRLKEENLNNCYLMHANLKEDLPLKDMFDFSIINGVLEWIPEDSKVELKDYFSRKKLSIKNPKIDPLKSQLNFLKMVLKNLKIGGRLYLAIENRFDYQHFLWKKDPHQNLFYTAFLPRFVSNIISNIYYGRPYVNYLHSFKKLEILLETAGFSDIMPYAAFPDYRFPNKIIHLKSKNFNFVPFYNRPPTKNIIKKIFRRIRRKLDLFIYKKLKLLYLAPSIIMTAKKE